MPCRRKSCRRKCAGCGASCDSATTLRRKVTGRRGGSESSWPDVRGCQLRSGTQTTGSGCSRSVIEGQRRRAMSSSDEAMRSASYERQTDEEAGWRYRAGEGVRRSCMWGSRREPERDRTGGWGGSPKPARPRSVRASAQNGGHRPRMDGRQHQAGRTTMECLALQSNNAHHNTQQENASL